MRGKGTCLFCHILYKTICIAIEDKKDLQTVVTKKDRPQGVLG